MCYRAAAAKVIDPVASSAARILLCIYPGGGGAVCPKRRGKGTGEKRLVGRSGFFAPTRKTKRNPTDVRVYVFCEICAVVSYCSCGGVFDFRANTTITPVRRRTSAVIGVIGPVKIVYDFRATAP